MEAELMGLAIAGAIAIWGLARAPAATLCALALLGALVDHRVVPAPRIELVERATAMRDGMTARAVCDRQFAVALLGEAAVSEEQIDALEQNCGAER
jgi:hypothetical protein